MMQYILTDGSKRRVQFLDLNEMGYTPPTKLPKNTKPVPEAERYVYSKAKNKKKEL